MKFVREHEEIVKPEMAGSRSYWRYTILQFHADESTFTTWNKKES